MLPDNSTAKLNLPRDCGIVGYTAGQLLVQLRETVAARQAKLSGGRAGGGEANKGVLGEAVLLFEPADTQAVDSDGNHQTLYRRESLLDNGEGRLKA